MIFGDPNHERIQLNEETIWAGTRVNDINPLAKAHLKEIQQLLLDGKCRCVCATKNICWEPRHKFDHTRHWAIFF